MKHVFSFVILIGCCCVVTAQSLDKTYYSSLSISDSIRKNSSAVYRIDEALLDISSSSVYTYKLHQVVTLLDESAESYLTRVIHYDKQSKVGDVEVGLFDASGRLLRKYAKKDFEVRGYLDDMSLHTDDKMLYLRIASMGYPCTIDYSYEIKATGYIELPDWVIAVPGTTVETSDYTVRIPANLDIRYTAYGTEIKPQVNNEGAIKRYNWHVTNVSIPRVENAAFLNKSSIPTIAVAPNLFEYDGYPGDMKSWKTFGAWNYQLFTDPAGMNPEAIKNIQQLVRTSKTDRERIGVLYDWLKRNTRYVSIQLGIGGFRPYPVQYVSEKLYGDCKALTNYMRYMLNAINIRSYPALINAGAENPPVNADFPSQAFNHVILCVPLAVKDTMWLECTSKCNEAGYLGSFTENKNALLLTENGGVIVRTPRSDYSKNTLSTTTVIDVNDDGSSNASAVVRCRGDYQHNFYPMISESQTEVEEELVNNMGLRHPDKFVFIKDDLGEVSKFRVNLSYDQQYDFKAGSKIFFPQKVNQLNLENILLTEKRSSDFAFRFPYCKRDTTIYHLPAGWNIETAPQAKEIATRFVNYKSSSSINDKKDTITIVSELAVREWFIPASAYIEVATTFQEIDQQEKQKIVVRGQ